MNQKKPKDIVWLLKNMLALFVFVMLFGAILFIADIFVENISLAGKVREYTIKSFGTIWLTPLSPVFGFKGTRWYFKRRKKNYLGKLALQKEMGG